MLQFRLAPYQFLLSPRVDGSDQISHIRLFIVRMQTHPNALETFGYRWRHDRSDEVSTCLQIGRQCVRPGCEERENGGCRRLRSTALRSRRWRVHEPQHGPCKPLFQRDDIIAQNLAQPEQPTSPFFRFCMLQDVKGSLNSVHVVDRHGRREDERSGKVDEVGSGHR